MLEKVEFTEFFNFMLITYHYTQIVMNKIADEKN